MIRFAVRPNLKYPLQLLLYNELRNIESILLNKLLKFDSSLVYSPLMFIGEFLSGLIIFSYQKKFVKKFIFKEEVPDKYMNLELIKTENRVKKIDGILKIIFILFCCAFFDFVQFILSINKIINLSSSICSRLRGFLTIFDALFYYFILKLNIYRHQFFCLIIIGICLLLVIIFEFIFQEINIFFSYGYLSGVIILSFIDQFFSAMTDSNEKYLFEYDNVNPFYALMFEGFFGFIFSFFYCLYQNPFNVLKDYKNNKQHSKSDFSILIFCLIIYIILSGLKNSFRVITTKVYTPMTTTSLDYILNPIYISIEFALGDDFMYKNKRNYAYFFINLIISLIISFFSLVYNEFLILYICNLDKETHQQISNRSAMDENIIYLDDIDDDDNYET